MIGGTTNIDANGLDNLYESVAQSLYFQVAPMGLPIGIGPGQLGSGFKARITGENEVLSIN